MLFRSLQAQGALAQAQKEYQQAIDMFTKFAGSDATRVLAPFHERYGEALFQLGTLRHKEKDLSGARGLFSQAVEQHAAAVRKTGQHAAAGLETGQQAAAGLEIALGFDYYWLAEANLALGAADQAQNALDQLAATLPKLPEEERGQLGGAAQQLRKKLDDRKPNGRTTH